jgi:hypothetical protein
MEFEFTQKLFLGFSAKSWPGSSEQELRVSSDAFESAGSYAGSSHIFEMGRHFDAYVADEFETPSFLPIPGFPSNPFFEQLVEKARSPGVTGNIGETLSGIVATETFGCNAADIGHLVVRSKKKTPDFLIRRTPTLEVILQDIRGTGELNLPDWWLVESKIRSGQINRQHILEGLIQLITVWFDLKDYSVHDIGCGIVIGTGLQPREIRIHVFTPQNNQKRTALIGYLHTLGIEPKFTPAIVLNILSFLS